MQNESTLEKRAGKRDAAVLSTIYDFFPNNELSFFSMHTHDARKKNGGINFFFR